MADKEAAFCPNCTKPAVRQGKVITCENCDASFRYTQEGPKLHEIGPLESRIKTVEEKLGIGEAPAQPATPAVPADSLAEPDEPGGDPAEPETDEDEDGI